MAKNPLRELHTFGQSIWLDFIRRGMLDSGELTGLVKEDELRGVTSNPAIFEKVIDGSHDYDRAIRVLALEGNSAAQIYDRLTVEDVQHATDLFAPIYQQTDGHDGFVSLEVSPHLAHDTDGTIAEAKRLWQAVGRPNLMIKVPATLEGLPAIKQLIEEGINVNVTLLFGLPRYRKVFAAFQSGLAARAERGQSLDGIASVASFFLSRIDVLVDPMLEKMMVEEGSKAELAKRLHGQVAVASAKKAYQIYKEMVEGDSFRRLANLGARPQRLLWASTSTKDPAYSDVKYVEALIGPNTVNTIPLETLNAYRDHGRPAFRLEQGLDQAEEVLERLAELDIDLDRVTAQLEADGVQKFNKPYDRLLDTLEKARQAALSQPVDRQKDELGRYETAVADRLAALETDEFVLRLWRKDASLWKSDPQDQEVIENALGWLHVPEKMEDHVPELARFAAQAKADGFRHVVHMGMGGSSLAPLLFQRTFTPSWNAIPVTVLDTTDPATILDIERKHSLADTLFIVASKSGTTAETRTFADYFYEKLRAVKGDRAGENFVAITDAGTPLDKLAQEQGYRHTFRNYPDIGGRYSALSYFGLVPAALMGVDVGELLGRALRMAHACAASVPGEQNPGLSLGAALGELGRQGRNKVTFLMPEPISTLGMWLEQLLAESTGKEGTGLLPVAGEAIGDPSVYGNDRLFVHFQLQGYADEELAAGAAALRESGQPVIDITMEDVLDLGQEFFRWEIATATAGAILGINAFNQPNVQESKDNTNRLLAEVREKHRLPEEEPVVEDGDLKLFNQDISSGDLAEGLAQFFARAQPGNYVAIMAYLQETPDTEKSLQALRLRLRDGLHLATTVGYGPRFLHSTGQLHKGGANTGLFLQLTSDEVYEVAVPGEPYTFGTLRRAQALGDLQALRKHGRCVARVHLGDQVDAGLQQLKEALATADRLAKQTAM